MNFETIIYEKINQIAKVTMNRPQARNAQNARMIEEMDIAFKDAENDDDIKVVILAGAGTSFSAGHDLKVYPEEEGGYRETPTVEEKWEYERDIFFEKLLQTWRMRKPVIAQVQGYCLGAGFMIANMCDLIVASENAKFGDPVVAMGAAAVEVLCHPWVLPPRIAKELLFTAEQMGAHRAYELGMVNKVVENDKLEEETYQLAGKIANMPPFAVRTIKQTVNRTMDMMGFQNAINAHFDTHIMSHFTVEAQTLLENNRKDSANLHKFIKKTNK